MAENLFNQERSELIKLIFVLKRLIFLIEKAVNYDFLYGDYAKLYLEEIDKYEKNKSITPKIDMYWRKRLPIFNSGDDK